MTRPCQSSGYESLPMNFPASITRQCQDLTELLGVACFPYLHAGERDSGVPNMEATYEAALQGDIAMALEAVGESLQSQSEAFVPIHDQRFAFAIPILEHGANAWFAIGRAEEPVTPNAKRLLRAAGEAARRKYQLDDQSEVIESIEQEMTRSYDERNWVRQLNAHRVANKTTVGMHTRHALESLKTLIQAEAVAIYIYSGELNERFGLEPCITSKSPWAIDDLKLLLQRTTKPRCGESLVLNNVGLRLPHGIIHSCVMIPIGDVEAIGYVVAINRRKRQRFEQGNGRSEFTSQDSELLHEVAIHLASDGYNNLLLHESEQLVLGTLRAMSNAIEARDPYTHGHSERVAHVGYEIARRLTLPDSVCQEIYLAGVLHDIGKIGIPDHVLMKPGMLDPEELAIIQKHPEIGFKIIEDLGRLKFALPGVLNHHERWDGRGYPQKLKGEDIPLMSRILAVSDAFDAMTSSRVYRNAMMCDRAVDILLSGAGTQWDASVVNAFIEYISESQSTSIAEAFPPVARILEWKRISQAICIART